MAAPMARVGIGARGGEHPGREGGVVAAAVLRVEHQAEIQQPRLLLGISRVGPQRVQDGLRRGQTGDIGVEIHAFPVVMAALDLVGIGHDGGQAGDKLNRLPQHVFHGQIVGQVVIGIQGQHRAGQLVHDVGGGCLDDHVLREVFGQFPVGGEDFGELRELLRTGQAAKQQQPRRLLETEAVFRHAAPHQVVDVDAAVNQAALHRGLLPFVHDVAVHVADPGQPSHNAAAVRVAQPPLDLVLFEFFRFNPVILFEFVA